MSAPINNIKNWSNVQLTEGENNDDSMNAIKYNKCCRQVRVWKEEVEQRACEEVECRQVEEQWRVEVERCRAEEQAKKHVSCFWLVMMELMVVRWRRLLHNSMARAR